MKIPSNRTFVIASVLSLLFFAPLLLAIIPLWVWAACRRRRNGGVEPGSSGTGPRPVGSVPPLSGPESPPVSLDNGNFQFHAMRLNSLLEKIGGDRDDGVDEEFVSSRGGNAWYSTTIADRLPGKDAVQVFAYPFGIQYLEIDRAKWTPGVSPSLDSVFADGAASDASRDSMASSDAERGRSVGRGGEFETPFGAGEESGTGFRIDSIQSGASPQNPGVRIVFVAKGSGWSGVPQRREDVPFLLVTFMIGEQEAVFLAPPAPNKAEWRFDEVFEPEMGIVDIAGEIPFLARIVNHRGGELTPDSIVPRSGVAVGLVPVKSGKVQL